MRKNTSSFTPKSQESHQKTPPKWRDLGVRLARDRENIFDLGLQIPKNGGQ
jgi:hypothetical protein